MSRTARNGPLFVLGFVIGALLLGALTGLRADQVRLDTGGMGPVAEVVNQHAAYLDEIKADFNLLRLQVLNSCQGYALLAEGTNANTIKTTNAVTFTIAGVNYTKAATDNIAMTALAAQADLTYCLYLVSIQADGDVVITKGTEVSTDTAVLPAIPADEAPLGYFKIATSGGTFTSGTTDLGAGTVTDTYVSLGYAMGATNASTAISNASAHTARGH